MKIKEVEFFYVDVPLKEIPQRNMERQLHGWRIFQICRIELDNGVEGFGETLPTYTWSRVQENVTEKLKGKSPAEFLWDDSLGAGVQMALFDVTGKAMGVPAYQLMGAKHRDFCPISWWAIDMPPEDYAAQAREAVELGYTSMKQKPRPWFDVYEQVKQTAANSNENFKIDLDFNGHLVNSANAVSVIRKLEKCPNVAFLETPIPQQDVEGNKRIRSQTRCAIAMHFGNPPFPTAVREQICDGFVIGGGAYTTLHQFACAARFNLPGWLQLVGTGITTTWGLHLGCVATHAQWPMITCVNMYQHQLIAEQIEMRGGFAKVPDSPGLGFELADDFHQFKVDSPDKPNVRAHYALVRASGDKRWFQSEMSQYGYWTESERGNFPGVFEHGVNLERWDDDGSKEWKDMEERLKNGPVSQRA